MRRSFSLHLSVFVAALILLTSASMVARAQDTAIDDATTPAAVDAAGQADLDEATALKLSASSMADLERVVELCESSIQKGLDEQSEQLAKTLISATLFQHGSRYAQALFDPNERTQRPAMLKEFALRDLYKILEFDDSLPQVHMMIARLEQVNTGRAVSPDDFKKGVAAADKAIELLTDNNEMLSKAYVLRAGYSNREERMEMLNKAIEADSSNADAWRLRGKSRLVDGEILAATGNLEEAKAVREEAIEDFTKLLEENPDDPDALQAVAELLGRLGNPEDGIEKATQAIEKNPRAASLFILRGRLYHQTKEYDKAIQDLNQAIDIQPDSFIAFLDRAEIHYDSGDKAAAAKDYGLARELQGQSITTAVVQRIGVRAEGNLEKAVEEIKRFAELDELNAEADDRAPDPDYSLQLGQSYLGTNQNELSVEVLTKVIERIGEDPSDQRMRAALMLALRTRADAFLGIGKHTEAVADYERALKFNENEDGVLNNLAWVLATSPNDDIRNAERSVELATKACEVTEYKQAHIISTLAAAYAESGDFEKAKQWSQQAVETGGDTTPPETLQQLKNELESYKQNKPWREEQMVMPTAENSEDVSDVDASTDADVSDSDNSDSDVSEDSSDADAE